MDMTAGKDTTLAPGVVISAAVAVTTSCSQGLASDSEAEGACPTLGVLYATMDEGMRAKRPV